MSEHFYRFEDKSYAAPLDEYERPMGNGSVVIQLHTFVVRKRTPKGVWIAYTGFSTPRFVLLSARKRFACPTIEEAMVSFLARKEKQHSIYRARMNHAERVINSAKNINYDRVNPDRVIQDVANVW